MQLLITIFRESAYAAESARIKHSQRYNYPSCPFGGFLWPIKTALHNWHILPLGSLQVQGFKKLSGCIHTCYLVNFCVDWKVWYWAVYQFFTITWTENFTLQFAPNKWKAWMDLKLVFDENKRKPRSSTWNVARIDGDRSRGDARFPVAHAPEIAP